MTPVRIDDVLARLEALRPEGAPAVVAFDGDGTLWSGDVGEDVFHDAVARRWLRDDAVPALRETAVAHGISPEGDAHAISSRLFEAYVAGSFPERVACEVLTWCFAGLTLDEFRERTRAVLSEKGIHERLQRELEPAFAYCRSKGLRTVVVSASPRAPVEVAAGLWGIAPSDVIAATPATRENRIEPALERGIPYAETKVEAARELVGEVAWLASFGDNVFDIEMFQAARIGIAVRPKRRLCERLSELSNVLVLEDPGAAAPVVPPEPSR